ncbi:siderophore-interacting protein [Microbacterium sp. bgisy189]|uniref:siderophore-interacting protein n=1 Tax=Microbacterium sp. bgisy189 TaxID=3413798 RepID=UPI003EBC0CB9
MTTVPAASAPAGRARGAQTVLEVVATEQLTPHLVRVHLGGPGFAAFVTGADPAKLALTDKYVKLLFADPALGLEPPYDMEALRETLQPHQMPTRRTYTIRSVGPQSLAIDFVVHGDEGIAGPWAARAVVGDKIAFSGPGAQFAPRPEAIERRYLGDDSAIPALAAALEALPADATGIALIEVDSAADEVDLQVPSGIELTWLHRRGDDGEVAPYGQRLVDAVAALPAPDGPVEVFAHGEREAMKRLRPIVNGEWGVPRADLSLSAYWAFGRAEDTFQAEKRAPVGQIFED